ncbi:MAG TPA: CHASE domain-containing protein [Rhodothermales bacterium]|nr:CHASE domain-containing protein [Rhodothermales bacterium]
MLRRPVLPWIVLTASLLLTAVAAGSLARSTRERDDEAFRNAVQTTYDRIGARLDIYIALLRGTAGLIVSREGNVTSAEFNAFAQRLRAQRNYPGIQGIGYSRRLRSPEEAAALVTERRREIPEFRLWPDTVSGDRHAIVYLYPLDRRNRHALGYDMHSQPTRRAAMDHARDAGTSTMSGRVTLVQEIEGRVQAGFLIYVPLYQGGTMPATVAERRERLIGYAYAPFRADDLFEGVIGTEDQPRVAYRIYDGQRADSAALLHDSRVSGIEPVANPRRSDTRTLTRANRHWTIVFTPTASFEQAQTTVVPYVVGGGMLVSLLLFGLTGAQVRTERLTRQNERRLRVVLESMPVAVTVADAGGQVTFRNAQAEAMESAGVAYHHETHQPLDPEAFPLTRALAGERVEGEILDLVTHEGLRRTVLASAFPVLDPSGRLRMAVSAVVDVTDQKRAEERAAQLRRQALELERSNRELQAFAYVASHDLQEPLRKISAFSDLVRADYGDRLDAEGLRYVERIQDAALRMSDLIKGLLAFSRVSTHARPFDQVPLDGVVEDVTQDLWTRLQETGGRVEADSLPTIRADAMQMRQLFQNLIGNALKFHRDGVPPLVRVRAERARITGADGLGGLDGWRITVQDNGIGFDERYAGRIFAPFQRLHTRGNYEGTGIGLAICRRIAERHGGRIYATSTPGEGSTFTVELPLNPPVAREG